MTIQWYGQNCFKIQGKDQTLIFDPFSKDLGLKVPKLSGDIILSSTPDNKEAESLAQDGHLISGPGEYEVSGVFVFGFESKGHDGTPNTIYMVRMEDMYITHLGNLSSEVDADTMEKLRKTHVLLLPVGGQDVLNSKQAEKIVTDIEPGMVIPMHYALKGLKGDLQGVDQFTKDVGVKPQEGESKVKVTAKEFAEKQTEFVVLSVS